MKKIVIIGLVFLILIVAFVFHSSSQKDTIKPASRTSEPSSTPSPHEVQATFTIYTNGTLRIFSDPRYHNLSEDVYIQPDNPSIIHVEKAGTTWGVFFDTLPMKLSAECLTTGTGQVFCTNENKSLKFYINRQLKPAALDMQIRDGDQLLVSFGDESQEEIDGQFEELPAVE